MPPKKRAKAASKRKPRPKAPRVNWRKAAVALAHCAIFTIGYSRFFKLGNMVNLKTLEPLPPWEEKFFDALDTIGVVYDRKSYYAKKNKRRR